MSTAELLKTLQTVHTLTIKSHMYSLTLLGCSQGFSAVRRGREAALLSVSEMSQGQPGLQAEIQINLGSLVRPYHKIKRAENTAQWESIAQCV